MNSSPLTNTTIGDYRILERLGSGGMGEVYRAVHTKIGRQVAIKILPGGMAQAGLGERFRNEARLQAGLQHPNIATMYDFLEFGGRPCIVMEYVDGETLADRIQATGGLPLPQALAMFESILEATAYLHEKGIVHRDLKPTNVRISSAGVVKLLDFGIARGESTPKLTATGNVAGTLWYLSPEQLNGGPASPRTDVWALGVLFYEMVAGRVPFEAETIGRLLEKIHKAQYAAPSSLRAAGAGDDALARATDRMLARCLQKDPRDRFASAGELRREVQALRALAVSSSPALRVNVGALIDRGLAAMERHWRAAAIVAFAALIVVLVLVFRAPAPPPAGRDPGVAQTAAGQPGGQSTARPAGGAAAPGAADLSQHQIAVTEGSADVYINGVFIGRTPCTYGARPDETVELELKQPGFHDYRDTFRIGAKRVWTLTMKRIEQD